MKVKLFTHTDLDGVASAIIGLIAFNMSVDVHYCTYDNINDIIVKEDLSQYDKIFITDISVSESIANYLDTHYRDRVRLFDHHGTALWLNQYNWALVKTSSNSIVPTCGTSMFYKYLSNNQLIPEYLESKMPKFVDLVRSYDTWEWVDSHNIMAKSLNDLLYIMGQEAFVSDMIFILRYSDDFRFLPSHTILLKVEQSRIDRYVEFLDKTLIKKVINEYVVGVVFADRYISEIGHRLAELHNDCDIIAIINLANKSINYRTIKSSINVGKFAQKFQGGGHTKSAGSSINDSVRIDIVNRIFDSYVAEEVI